MVRNIKDSQGVREHLSYLASRTTEVIEATASDENCVAYHNSRWRRMTVGFAACSLTTSLVDLNGNRAVHRRCRTRADGRTLSSVKKRHSGLDYNGLYSLMVLVTAADERCTSPTFGISSTSTVKRSPVDIGQTRFSKLLFYNVHSNCSKKCEKKCPQRR